MASAVASSSFEMCSNTPWRDSWKGWDDREAALVTDAVERLAEGQALRDRLLDAQREDVAGGTGHLHARNPDEVVLRCEFGGPETGVDLVVVGDRERVQPDGAGLL